MSAPDLTPANRDHESIEKELLELMTQDKKLRESHDQLTERLATIREEMAAVAAKKFGLLSSLSGVYKKHTNGQKGKRGVV